MRMWLLTLTGVGLVAAAAPAARANWIFGEMDPYPGYYHPSYYFPYAPTVGNPYGLYGGYGLLNCYAGYPPAYYAEAFAAAAAQQAAAYGAYGAGGAYCPPGAAPGYCPPNVAVRYEPRVVTGTRPEHRAEKVAITVPKVNYREEVTNVKTIVMTPRLFDSKQLRTEYVPVPRQVDRVVTTCRTVPFVTVDPCTGCPVVGCQLVPEMHKLSATVFDYQPRVHEVPVKVVRTVPEERTVPQSRFVPYVTQEQTWTIRNTTVMVPYQQTVNVPVYTVTQPPPQ